jgi:glucose/arabinose dehydrogenase
MTFVPDGDMVVTERPGRPRVIRKGVLDPLPIGPLPARRAAVLGGLMDVVLHPKFAQNRLIYFVYSKPGAEEPAKGRLRWHARDWMAAPL